MTTGSRNDEGPNLDSLSARERELRQKIEQLQDYVEHGPERERQAAEERLCTLPPPAEIEERKREKQFMEKLSRNELKNERRNQTKSGLLMLLLILATLAVGFWIYQIIS